MTVATADIDALSVAPSQQATEILQTEYQRLLAEYEGIVQENEAMESEVNILKHGKQTQSKLNPDAIVWNKW